eukprot:7572603-Alexandrium_andersonii.AAC.1
MLRACLGFSQVRPSRRCSGAVHAVGASPKAGLVDRPACARSRFHRASQPAACVALSQLLSQP